MAGAIGGLACFVVSTPTELIKCRAQARFDSRNSWAISKDIFRESGLRGFFRGGVVTSLRDSIGYGFYFWAYEASKQSSILEAVSPTTRSLVAGGIAGCVTWASVYPLDVVKTLVQVDSELAETIPLLRRRKPLGTISCAREIYARGGIPGFFKGFWACMARAFVVNAVTFFAYELVMNKMQAYSNGNPGRMGQEEKGTGVSIFS
jgi:solute carrier family 25 carnitine/acylcarnitine transporter 20/29